MNGPEPLDPGRAYAIRHALTTATASLATAQRLEGKRKPKPTFRGFDVAADTVAADY